MKIFYIITVITIVACNPSSKIDRTLENPGWKKVLNLSYGHLREFPKIVCKLTELQELNLFKNL
jgi:hypothetical protein